MVTVSRDSIPRSSQKNAQEDSFAVPPPAIFRETMAVVLGTVVLMQGVYYAVKFGFAHGWTETVWGLTPASAETCQQQQQSEEKNEKCGRPDLFAFQMVSGLTFVCVGALGLALWHSTGPGTNNSIDLSSSSVHQFATPAARLYGYQRAAKWLTIINLAYQVWDFAISLTIPEHCTAIMLTHHAVAATVAFSGVYNHMLGYYATFFLGLSEVSSIFLVTLDMSKYFEPQPGSLFEAYTDHLAKPLFAVSFVYYRVIAWWPISKLMLDDVRVVTKSGQAETLRPGRTWILYMWLILNFPMGLLQLYWTSIILANAKATLIGS